MKWEYRCVKFPFPDDFNLSLPFKDQYADLPTKHTELLNELGAEGWEWIHAERDLFYFRRAMSEYHLTLHTMAERLNEGNESRTVEETEKTLAEFIKAQDR